MCSESFRTLGLACSWVRTHLPCSRPWLLYLYRRNKKEGTGHGLQCLSPVPPKQEKAKVGHLSLVTAVASVVEASVSLTSLPAFSFSSHLVLSTFQLSSARENCHCGKALEPSILTCLCTWLRTRGHSGPICLRELCLSSQATTLSPLDKAPLSPALPTSPGWPFYLVPETLDTWDPRVSAMMYHCLFVNGSFPSGALQKTPFS